ncbi:Clp protease, partial [Vibrio parahaemolyticus]
YDAAEQSGAKFVIDAAYVKERLGDTIENEDLSRFIL